ncbi:MAG: sulfurtransferase TusA family protein [Candidatus Berkiellales bacterium]
MNPPDVNGDIYPDIELDARNLLCPMPVIRLQNKIKTLTKGSLIRVLCTDPGTLHDIPTWCRMYGHHVLDTHETEEEIQFLIKVT